MKYSFLLGVVHFLFMLAKVICEQPVIQVSGGVPIAKEDYLWFVGIEELTNEYPGYRFLCSGALIGSVYVLTAFHCVENQSVQNLRFSVSYYCNQADNCRRLFHKISGYEIRRPPGKGDMAIIVLFNNQPSQTLLTKRNRILRN